MNPDTQQFSLDAAGGLPWNGVLGFQATGMTVTNNSNIYLYEPRSGQFVAPGQQAQQIAYTTYGNTTNPQLRAQAPDGVTQPSPAVGSVQVTVTDDPTFTNAPGSAQSPSITINGPVTITGTVDVAVQNTPSVTIASGTVDIGNTPSVTISGTPTVSVTSGTVDIGNTPSVTVTSGTVSISGTPNVAITSGTVSIGNTPNINISSQSITVGVEQNESLLATLHGTGSPQAVAVPAWADTLVLIPASSGSPYTVEVQGATTSLVYLGNYTVSAGFPVPIVVPIAPAADATVNVTISAAVDVRVVAVHDAALSVMAGQTIKDSNNISQSVGYGGTGGLSRMAMPVAVTDSSGNNALSTSSGSLPVGVAAATAGHPVHTGVLAVGAGGVGSYNKLATITDGTHTKGVTFTLSASVAASFGIGPTGAVAIALFDLAAAGTISVTLPAGDYIDLSVNNFAWVNPTAAGNFAVSAVSV